MIHSPMTDAQKAYFDKLLVENPLWIPLSDYARTLERENAKLLKEREEIKEGIDEAMRDIELSSTRNAMSTLRALLAKLGEKG